MNMNIHSQTCRHIFVVVDVVGVQRAEREGGSERVCIFGFGSCVIYLLSLSCLSLFPSLCSARRSFLRHSLGCDRQTHFAAAKT